MDAMKNIVKQNLLLNCDITLDDIERGIDIYGTPTPLIVGRLTSPKQVKHRAKDIHVPSSIIHKHRNISLFINLCYINKLCFLICISENIEYVNIEFLNSKKSDILYKELNKIIKLYSSRGFQVNSIYGDNEFDVDDIKTSLMPIKLHICGANEHVPKIERCIRTFKERARSMYHALPYNTHQTHDKRTSQKCPAVAERLSIQCRYFRTIHPFQYYNRNPKPRL